MHPLSLNSATWIQMKVITETLLYVVTTFKGLQYKFSCTPSPQYYRVQVTCLSRANYLLAQVDPFSTAPSHKWVQFGVFSRITQLWRRRETFLPVTGTAQSLLLLAAQQPALKTKPPPFALPLYTDGRAWSRLRDSGRGVARACAQQRSWFATSLSANHLYTYTATI